MASDVERVRGRPGEQDRSSPCGRRRHTRETSPTAAAQLQELLEAPGVVLGVHEERLIGRSSGAERFNRRVGDDCVGDVVEVDARAREERPQSLPVSQLVRIASWPA